MYIVRWVRFWSIARARSPLGSKGERKKNGFFSVEYSTLSIVTGFRFRYKEQRLRKSLSNGNNPYMCLGRRGGELTRVTRQSCEISQLKHASELSEHFGGDFLGRNLPPTYN